MTHQVSIAYQMVIAHCIVLPHLRSGFSSREIFNVCINVLSPATSYAPTHVRDHDVSASAQSPTCHFKLTVIPTLSYS